MISIRQQSQPPVRGGATLTEVLISLLIMSIGVVSVFTLFPISILRAIHATQQTNSRLHKLNTTELVRTNPFVLSIHSPPAGTPAAAPGDPQFLGQWSANTEYDIGDVVTPAVSTGSAFPVPDLWFVCIDARDNSNAPPTGTSSLVEPAWNSTGTTTEFNPVTGESVVWAPLPFIHVNPADQRPSNAPTPLNAVTLPWHRTDRYVVDPLGWAIAQADGSFGSDPFIFGNKTNAASGTGTPITSSAADPFQLLRINGSINTQALAVANTSLIDSWETVVEATPLSVASPLPSMPPMPGQVVFPPDVGLAGLNRATGLLRIKLISTDGSMTVTRPISQVSAAAVEFPRQTPLPTRFPRDAAGDPDVGLAIIEVFDQRHYTWFLTVNRDSAGNANIKVVVVFNRSFLPEEEHLYDANFGNPDIDVDQDGTEDGMQRVGVGDTQVKLAWNPNPSGPMPQDEPEPLLKPGNFLFDARTCEWYRIQNVDDEWTNTSSGLETATLTLDKTVNHTADDGMGPPANPVPGFGRVILMRGIIDVYDL